MASSQSLQTVQNQLKTVASQKKRTQIVEKSIKTMPTTTQMYSSVGKVFIPKTQPEVLEMCKVDVKELDENFMALLKKKEYFEKQITELQRQVQVLNKQS